MRRVVCLALLIASAVAGADPCEPLTGSSATGEIKLRGADGPIRYETTYSRIAVPDEAGLPQGTISAISYQQVGDDARGRPVLFAFGGGPGAAASDLNFGLLGPQLLNKKDSAAAPLDNPDTLLDVADLVMIDTPGSGFNCELRPDGQSYFYTARSDARATELLIRQWLEKRGRQDAPIYLLGASYGGYRIGVLSPNLTDLNMHGAILVAPALDLTDQPGSTGTPDDHFVFAFPTMAVAAVHQMFLDSLIPNHVVGRIDTRVSAAVERSALIEGRSRAADDPALGLGASNLRPDPVVGDYLRGLGVTLERPYISLNLNMNLNLEWAFGTRSIMDTTRLNPTYRIADLAKAKPDFRVLLIGGYYDMTTPVLAARHALTHSNVPREQVKMVAFPGPHSVYADDSTRSGVAQEIRALIRRSR